MTRSLAQHRLGLAVLALVVATLGFGVWVCLPLIGLALSDHANAATDAATDSNDRFLTNLDTYTGRLNGRYLFFGPPPPRPEPRPIVREEPDDAPPPPATYGGPRIVAMFADEVWFADGRRLRIGGEEDGSLRVIGIDSPWSADVEWRGVTFTIDFFPRNKVVGALRPDSAPQASAMLDQHNGE